MFEIFDQKQFIMIYVNTDAMQNTTFMELNLLDEKIEEKLYNLSDRNSNFLINLSDIDYINSLGISLLLILRKKLLEKGNNVLFCCAREKVLQLIKYSGLTDLFDYYQGEEEAIYYIKSCLIK